MKRIVFTAALGKPKFAEMALGLARSLRLIGDDHRRAIVTDLPGYDWHRYFDVVLKPTGPRSSLDKFRALELTDADQVLWLDGDMLAFKRLDDIFEFCAGKPYAVQGFMETKGSFHGLPSSELLQRYGVAAFPRINSGLTCYERNPKFDALLKRMEWAEANYDTLGFESFRGGKSDEVCAVDAMLREGYVDLIPPKLHFQHSAAGLVGKLHLDVIRNDCSFVARQESVEFVRPYVFHAWRFKDFLVYWRQLEKLKKLEEFEDKHPTLYISRSQRRLRSLHRRLIKVFYKAEGVNRNERG